MLDEQGVQKVITATYYPRMAATFALGFLALFLLVVTVGQLMSFKYIGAGIQAANTITVNGEGKITAVPDTATFTYTVEDTAADVATAQSKATTQANAIISYLTGAGVDSTDIQTSDYSISPQYQYSSQVCPAYGYCPPQTQTISGYQVSQTETVKVTDISKAGTLLSGVGQHGASDVSGLTFTVSNEQDLENQARDKAIADARSNAQDLASALGVSIVNVVSYTESSNNPSPVVYAMASDAAVAPKAAAVPNIPAGQNTITSDVSVTYQIR